MVTIGLEQLFISITLSKHKYLDNIKKLYNNGVFFYNKHEFEAIIEAETFSSYKYLYHNSPMALASLVATNNTSARNSPHPFFEQFDVNQKNTSHKHKGSPVYESIT